MKFIAENTDFGIFIHAINSNGKECFSNQWLVEVQINEDNEYNGICITNMDDYNSFFELDLFLQNDVFWETLFLNFDDFNDSDYGRDFKGKVLFETDEFDEDGLVKNFKDIVKRSVQHLRKNKPHELLKLDSNLEQAEIDFEESRKYLDKIYEISEEVYSSFEEFFK